MNELNYTGYIEADLNDESLAELIEKGTSKILSTTTENQYVIAHDEHGKEVYFKCKNGKYELVKYPFINSILTGQLKPRNPQQYCAMDMLLDESIPVKLITGKFGSGKTLACIDFAIQAIEAGKFEKIVFVRNNVQVANTDSLGALPGDELEKTLPYVMPFADHCGGKDGLMRLIHDEKLEVIPLAFLRGRSIRNAIIYSMESENLTKEQIQLIMGRVDEGSILVMDGDIKQRDKAAFEKSMGLERMVSALKGNKLFGYIHLVKSERSEVSALADLLDE
jgi:Predicted ATPase related to phosphate starvation-inducible protein PhoH